MLRVIFFLLPFQIYAVNYKYCNQFIAENVGPVFKKDLVFNDDGKVNNPGDFGSFNEKEKIKTYGAFTKGRDYKVYYNDNDRPYLVEYKFNGSSHLLELTTQNNVCRVTNYIESIDRDKAGFIYSESACFEAYLFKHNSEKINSLTYEGFKSFRDRFEILGRSDFNNLPQDTPRSYKEINVIYSMNPPKVQTLETMALIDFKKVVEASTSYLEIVEGLRTENERLTEENKVLTKRRKELNESKKLFGKKKRKKEITNISNQLLENNLKISNNLEKIKKEMAEQETRNYRLDEGIVIKFDGNKAALIMNDFYEQNCSMFSNEVMESKKRIYEATQTPSTQDASEEEKKAIKQ